MCDPPLWTASVEGRDGSHSLMLVPGERVDGTVVRHEPYGAFVDIGEQELAASLLDAVVDGNPSRAHEALPPWVRR